MLTDRESDAPEDEASSKLDPRLAQAAAGQKPAGLSFRGGSVAVEIWLAEATPQLLTTLKNLGFQVIVESRVARVRIGWLAANKLEEVAAMKEVRYIAPHHVQ